MMMILGVFLSEWTYYKMNIRTVDSRSESLHQILDDISPNDAVKLNSRGWRYPKQVLHNWREAKEQLTRRLPTESVIVLNS